MFDKTVQCIDVTPNDVLEAAKNWTDWVNVFEHGGPAVDNPLLAQAPLFSKFLREYSVARTVQKGRSDQLRERLRSGDFPLQSILEDRSGTLLDTQERILRTEFGTYGGTRGLRSAMSKIVAFLAPCSFNAWDQYAKRGLHKMLPTCDAPASYAEYLGQINSLLFGELGRQVRDACARNYPTPGAAEGDRFHRRVLDVYLMRLGDRGGKK
jgi:hypothetical protein